MKHPRRLLLITEFYPPHVGGVEIVFEQLAKRFVKAGHEVTVVTSRLPGTKFRETRDGVKIRRVWVPRILDRYFFTFLSLWKVLREARKVDLIQTTTINAAFPGWLASKLKRIPAVLMVHEIYGPRWRKTFGMGFVSAGLHRFLERALFWFKFDRYVAVSESTAKDLRKLVPSKKISVIHHGIDEEIFDRSNYDREKTREKLGLGDEFVYLFFGRAGVSKGLEYLVRAIPTIREKLPESRCLIVLSKKPKGRAKWMRRLIQRLHLGDAVKVVDSMPIKELAATIVACDGVVIPSLAEGFGFAAAESCALGAPVVVSDTSSLPEVVSGKVIFVKPGDSASIAEGVVKLEKGEWERVSGKKFLWEEATKQYLELYGSIL